MRSSDQGADPEAPLQSPLTTSPAEAAPAPSGTRIGETFAALRHPSFRLFWTGALISNVGSWMQNVAQGWLVLDLTDSAFMLGLVGFAGTAPMLFFLLVGGVYADRLDRRKLLVASMTAMMVFAAILAVLTQADVVSVWHVFVLSLLSGTALAMAAPAYQAFVHDLVGRRDLQNAIALNSAQFNGAGTMGKPSDGASLMLAATSAASHIAFFGTQPTLTQVPPSRCGSSRATRAPCSAARNAPARPPEPPPMTIRSNCVVVVFIQIARCGRGPGRSRAHARRPGRRPAGRWRRSC